MLGFDQIVGVISVLECLLNLMFVMAFLSVDNLWPLRAKLYGRDLLVLVGSCCSGGTDLSVAVGQLDERENKLLSEMVR